MGMVKLSMDKGQTLRSPSQLSAQKSETHGCEQRATRRWDFCFGISCLIFLSWQIQWWWVLMIDTCGLQVQVQVCWDFLLQWETEVPNKESTTTCRLFRKKTPTGPTDVYRFFSINKKKNKTLDPWVFKPPLPTIHDAHDVEVHRDGSPKWIWTVDAGIRALGWETPPETHPFFFEAIYGKLEFPTVLIPWSSSWWTGWISWTVSMKNGVFTLFSGWGRWMGGVGYLAMICLD